MSSVIRFQVLSLGVSGDFLAPVDYNPEGDLFLSEVKVGLFDLNRYENP